MKLYEKFDPGTYITRELYRKVCETKDLSIVWAHKNSQKWGVDYDEFLTLCKPTCSCCGSELDYGLGKNNNDKPDENTPSTDHIIPRSKGGTDDINNLWIICNKCNTLKNNATYEDIKRYESIIRVLKETRKN
jgi:5-methylcytosine-specific restriction endonuclease McrA